MFFTNFVTCSCPTKFSGTKVAKLLVSSLSLSLSVSLSLALSIYHFLA